jgi:hypothetical protein
VHGLLIASKEGYCATRQQVDFESVTGEQKIILREAPVINGRVVWKESKEPIAKGKVVCMPVESDMYQVPKVEAQTDEEGNFNLAISAEGAAKLWAEFVNAFQPEPTKPNIVLVAGEKMTGFVLEVELLSDTILEGRVLDQDGGPVPGAEVRLSGRRMSQSVAARSQDDGHYRLMVRRDWAYQSYFVEDTDYLEFSELGMAIRAFNWGPQGARIEPRKGKRRDLPDGKWDWAEYWMPPPDAPPERLLAFHPDYEMGVVEVPLLGPGQVRQGVDIVLYKGSRVSGKVLDDSSQPVVGANIFVKLKPQEGSVLIENDLTDGFPIHDFWSGRQRGVKSEKEGAFEIRFLREGSYELTAYQDDCDSQAKELELQPHQVVEGFDFVLVKKIGFIRGMVLDQRGKPWPHGKVRAWPFVDYGFVGKGYSSVVKEDGSYELTHLEPAKYYLWFDISADYPESKGILWAASLRDVPTGTEGANIIVTELPAGSLRVRVVDQAQQPIERFHLECCPLSFVYGGCGLFQERLKRAKDESVYAFDSYYGFDPKHSGVLLFKRDITSESGEFVAEKVAPGNYFVSVKAEKGGEEFREAGIEAGGETMVTFELKSLGRLKGLVVDRWRQPLQGIVVRAMKVSDFLNSIDRVSLTSGIDALEDLYGPNAAVSAQDGRFVLGNLEQGEYRVEAVDRRGRTVCADVTVAETGQGYVELVFSYGSGSIGGFVYGEDGNPVSRTQVSLESSAGKSYTETDEGGYYLFSNLVAGSYLVKAQIGGERSQHYRGQEIELGEGEEASVDLVAWGDGEIEGSVTVVGDAARAATLRAAFRESRYTTLLLREMTGSMGKERRELRLPVDEKFEIRNIPSGAYEAQAYFVVEVSPGRLMVHSQRRPCYVKFISEPEIVRVAPGARAFLYLTISEACAPHYPIPDPATCGMLEPWMFFED